ncbi:hypothetical protein GCM10017710_35510 [Arthrobacter ramosus]
MVVAVTDGTASGFHEHGGGQIHVRRRPERVSQEFVDLIVVKGLSRIVASGHRAGVNAEAPEYSDAPFIVTTSGR